MTDGRSGQSNETKRRDCWLGQLRCSSARVDLGWPDPHTWTLLLPERGSYPWTRNCTSAAVCRAQQLPGLHSEST
jgi:hypothetical protein